MVFEDFSAYAKGSKFSSNESARAQNNEPINPLLLNTDVGTFSNTVGPDKHVLKKPVDQDPQYMFCIQP